MRKRSIWEPVIWGIWIVILIWLLIYNMTYDSGKMTLVRVLHSVWKCIVPYVLLTFFYVLALAKRNWLSIPFFVIIDILKVIFVVNYIGLFYQGPIAARNAILLIAVSCSLKMVIMWSSSKIIDGFKKRNKKWIK